MAEQELQDVQFKIQAKTEELIGEKADPPTYKSSKLVKDSWKAKDHFPSFVRDLDKPGKMERGSIPKHYKHCWGGNAVEGMEIAICTQSGFVKKYDAKSGLLCAQPIISRKVMEVGLSATGKMVAYGGMDNKVTVSKYHGKEPTKSCEFTEHEGYIASLIFIGEDKLLSGSGDGLIKLWDLSKKACVQTWAGHDGDVTGVAMHEDDPNIFGTSSTDKTCRMWDIRTKYAYRAMKAKYATNCCALMPGARGIVAGCDNASWEYFDTACNAQVARGKTKKGRCEAIAVSKSGRVTYTGWDGDTGLVVADTYRPDDPKKIEDPKKHTETVYCLNVSPDGTALASCGFDGVTKIWSAPPAAA